VQREQSPGDYGGGGGGGKRVKGKGGEGEGEEGEGRGGGCSQERPARKSENPGKAHTLHRPHMRQFH
jgi:hypothetical protein